MSRIAVERLGDTVVLTITDPSHEVVSVMGVSTAAQLGLALIDQCTAADVVTPEQITGGAA